MDLQRTDWELSVRLRRGSWLMRAHVVEVKAACLAEIIRASAKFDPNQPRMPAGNPDGGQWTGVEGSSSVGAHQGARVDESVQLAADITGFTKHGINRAISRGISPSAIHDAVVNPIQILPQADGTTRYVGAGAVVVLDPAGSVITIWGQ